MFSVFLFSIAVSCSSSQDEVKIPEGILSREEFIKVITDLSLAESAANLNVKNVKMEKMDSVYAFNPLKENKISRGKFDSTASFYARHPKLYKEVYDEALKKLTEMEAARKGTVKDTLKK
ncbi:MAG: DUF4296 domain-containing protein [Bacteroidetes bacterium]|nr:DUF4296 domain-containing protein [Bacteroidota bacterium]